MKFPQVVSKADAAITSRAIIDASGNAMNDTIVIIVRMMPAKPISHESKSWARGTLDESGEKDG